MSLALVGFKEHEDYQDILTRFKKEQEHIIKKERNSIYLSEASFLIKRNCNLICMIFCQLWFILLLLFIYLLGKFWLLGPWTKAERTLSSITLDLPSGIGKLHLFYICESWDRGDYYATYVFRKPQELYYVLIVFVFSEIWFVFIIRKNYFKKCGLVIKQWVLCTHKYQQLK